MFKKLFLSVIALVLGCVAYAQVENPVSWSAKVESLGNNLYEIVLTGDITGDWHIYDLGPYEGGPIATSVTVAGGAPYPRPDYRGARLRMRVCHCITHGRWCIPYRYAGDRGWLARHTDDHYDAHYRA